LLASGMCVYCCCCCCCCLVVCCCALSLFFWGVQLLRSFVYRTVPVVSVRPAPGRWLCFPTRTHRAIHTYTYSSGSCGRQSVMEQGGRTPERLRIEAARLEAERRWKAAYLETQKARTLELQVNWVLVGYFFFLWLVGYHCFYFFTACYTYARNTYTFLHRAAREGSASCAFSV